MNESYAFGQAAEQRAVTYFKSLDYNILDQNYRYRSAEVDLIVKKNDLLIAVEVKARKSLFFGSPEQFVSPKKIKLLVMAMDHFIQSKELEVELRFDIIGFIYENAQWKLNHIKNAFYIFW